MSRGPAEDNRRKPAPPDRDDGAPWRNFYGRRKGKALRPGQIAHLERTLPRLAIPNVTWVENRKRRPLDLDTLFGRAGPTVLEIGFGGGEHLLAQSLARPDTRFIGCEPFINGVATLVPRLAEVGSGNVRLHPGDARDLLDVIPPGALAEVFLLYPDPWPKKKHHRRRFVAPDTVRQITAALAPGGLLRIATDIPDYARHALSVIGAGAQTGLDWTAEGPSDWRQPWPGWHRTRYEAKAVREGRRPIYLVFRKRH